MTNKDKLLQQKADFAKKLKAAFEAKDENLMMQVFDEFSTGIQQILVDTAAEFTQTSDSTILATRGIRQLTSAEQKFYDGLIAAFKSPDVKQALIGADLTIPETVIDTVISDIKREHPLLDAIDFQNTHGSLKWLYSDGSKPLATWAKLTSAITEELSGTIKEIDFSDSKLSGFLPVPKDMLDLAAPYIDSYVRIILAEAIANGFENGCINGTGNNQPIGMTRNLTGAVKEGVYSEKKAVTLKSLGVKDYCNVVAKLSKRGNGESRTVNSVVLICNPTDYINKVVPATTVLATDGSYKNNIFPFPTTSYQSEFIEEGKCIIGLPKQYLALVSGGKDGNISYSDENQWLEDNRVYKVKAYGTGTPKDNNSFIVCDISELEPLSLLVKVENTTVENTTVENTTDETE